MNSRSVATRNRCTVVHKFAGRGRYFALQTAIVLGVATASISVAPIAQAADCTPGSQPYPPAPCALTVSKTVVPEGGSLTICGAGFLPAARISLDIFSLHIHLADLNADPQGDGCIKITLPLEVDPGTYILKMDGKNTDETKRELSATITVVEKEAPTPPQGQSKGGLASTGAGVAWLAGLAGGSLGTGALAVLLVRRRRRNTHAR